MATFDDAFLVVLREEGGLTDDPHDPGGLTKFGISKKAYPYLDIAKLTEADAKAIYRKDYWQPVRADEVPAPLALCLFDAAVNMGTGTAVKLLQRALKISDDGVFGAGTLNAVKAAHLPDLVARFMGQRGVYYSRLSTFGNFGYGWLVRLFRVTQDAERMARNA